LSGLLAELCPKGVESVQRAVASAVAKSRDEVDLDQQVAAVEEGPQSGPTRKQEHVMEQYYASRALRR